MRTFFDPSRLARSKVGYTARRLDVNQPFTLVNRPRVRPRHGDLVVATVTEVGRYGWLMTAAGRSATLYIGDELVLACGARYAPDEFEAELPDNLELCDLASRGGLMGVVRSRHAAAPEPTRLRPLGLLGDSNERIINLSDLALPDPPFPVRRPPTFIVFGTAMNSGKTTTAACLGRGLTQAGLRVGAAKVTGTGNSNDPWMYRDAGVAEVLDFIDAGLAGTFRIPVARLLRCIAFLRAHLIARGVDAVILEVADGLLHRETAKLFRHSLMRQLADAVLFAAGDSAGAVWGVRALEEAGYPVLVVSGSLTRSPLAIQETQAELDVPIYSSSDLVDPAVAGGILERAIAGITPGLPVQQALLRSPVAI